MKKEETNVEWARRILKEAGLNPDEAKTIPLDEFVNSKLNTEYKYFDDLDDKSKERIKRLYDSFSGNKKN